MTDISTPEALAAFNRIAVIGAGTMGRGIAYHFALQGFDTLLINRGETGLAAARETIARDLEKKVGQGRLAAQQAAAVLQRIAFTTRLADAADAGLIIESVAEDAAIKTALLAELSRLAAADAVIATNTSSLSLNKLAAAVEHPARFIGLHFFNPAQLMKLVEIIPSFFTADSVIARCQRLLAQSGKATVRCQATPGFIVNRMARPFYLESFRLLEENVASARQIDRALKATGLFRMGPLELTDLIGQDINFQVSTQIWQSLQFDARYTPVYLQGALVDAGLLGRKNGRSYFAASGDPAETAAGAEDAPDSLILFGHDPLARQLAEAVQARWPAVRLERRGDDAELGSHLLVNQAFIIKASDGRTAAQLAAAAGRDVFVVDVSLDYAAADYLVAAHSPAPAPAHLALFGAALRALAPVFDWVKDSPGLIVARVLCSLINESVVMVEGGVCAKADIQLAATSGVNYASSPYDWLDALGEARARTILGHLASQLHPYRYRPHYALQRNPPLAEPAAAA
ncbi:3-hydroxyacyl-CoA dehydrogenase NAD-binding domain-containing protein [Chromobacterium sp. IIBBL 290-4]|uniref:3-hydroxyacyl-CoA dehydrogenase NAD-binding domain-containing protein n=1 Tax=Chromobacterium sp. IIBBL 290-4 TaxID=2953890 RepID=UPI0020B6615C|nr:3-hydroxyacyl-CoA dehydrogenase NAD-binding domain-containing protein [Chromobacterium sp. IIBBL 290-4]UTH75720.1 3-hydroxyacyl-CoA dehydrogenase NAD-binding domain-containing protein [Chromobacterium sp. IIBBL 290-4]